MRRRRRRRDHLGIHCTSAHHIQLVLPCTQPRQSIRTVSEPAGPWRTRRHINQVERPVGAHNCELLAIIERHLQRCLCQSWLPLPMRHAYHNGSSLAIRRPHPPTHGVAVWCVGQHEFATQQRGVAPATAPFAKRAQRGNEHNSSTSPRLSVHASNDHAAILGSSAKCRFAGLQVCRQKKMRRRQLRQSGRSKRARQPINLLGVLHVISAVAARSTFVALLAGRMQVVRARQLPTDRSGVMRGVFSLLNSTLGCGIVGGHGHAMRHDLLALLTGMPIRKWRHTCCMKQAFRLDCFCCLPRLLFTRGYGSGSPPCAPQ